MNLRQALNNYLTATLVQRNILLWCVFLIERSNLVSTSGETSQGKWHLDSLEYGQEAVTEEGNSSGDLWVTAEHRRQTSGSE